MPYESTFHDNASYGASDVNAALAQFVTSGIADPFTDGVPYNASKLNEIIHGIAMPGVVPETDTSCKCILNTDAHTVRISAGTAFFADGSRITFDMEGETLPYTPGRKQYVYLRAAPEENRCYPVCSAAEPSGDYVMLAEISADGTLTDRRAYAKGKVPGYQSDYNMGKKIVQEAITENFDGIATRTHTISTGLSNIRFAALSTNPGRMAGIYDSTADTDGTMLFLYNRSKGGGLGWYDRYDPYYVTMTMTVSGGNLVLKFESNAAEIVSGTFPACTIYVY